MAVEGKWSRRAVLALLAAASTQVLTQSSRHAQTEVTIRPPYSEASVNKRVFELLQESPYADKDISRVYTGGYIPYLTPDMYKVPVSVNTMSSDLVTHTELYFKEDTENENDIDKSKVSARICFGKKWYEMISPQAQLLSVNYAARVMLQMPAFTRYQYKKHIEQGISAPISNIETENEYSVVLGMDLIAHDEEVNKLFTYGPLLLSLEEYDNLESEYDIDLKRDMDLLLPEDVRREVNTLGINYIGLSIHTPEYAELAFGENPWTDFVKNAL